MSDATGFFERGWVAFPPDPVTEAWADAARPLAEEIFTDPGERAAWLRCGDTWFAGVNVFPNDDRGAVPDRGVPPLAGPVVDFVRETLRLDGFAWDRAQISVCLPGYPQPWDGESEAAFRFRRDRDAAHVDGLLRDEARRRRLGEVHGFILGLPLTEVPEDAAPLVVWEGSHTSMREAFRARFAGVAPMDWAAEDITDAYTEARRAVFSKCRRVAVTVPCGGAYLVHRLALHGVAPWGPRGGADPRSIAYFRPDTGAREEFPDDPSWWLEDP
ncbi:MAG: hypothetical protein AAF713_07580 [Pseudomonadota bacterium]